MISTEFKLGKLALLSYLPFSIISQFTFFSFQVTPAGLSWKKLARKDYKTTTFLCVLCFSHKETISYNKNIVQLIFPFGSVNSRNLSPLTELITKTIERTTSVWRKIDAVSKPRTSEPLVNLVFFCQTGIRNASIRFRDWQTDGHNQWTRCTKSARLCLG